MKHRSLFPSVRRRALSLFCVTVLLLQLWPSVTAHAASAPVIMKTKYAYLYNITHDKVLYSSGATQTTYPASTVKIMTALVAIEMYTQNWNTEILITSSMLRNVSGNRIGLRQGEIVTFRDLINCMIIGGANDCAQALAYTIAGGTDAFVELMNQKAAQLGMTHTTYTNVTGMHDEKMVTTLEDVVLLALYAYRNLTFRSISGTYKYEMSPTNKTTNSRKIYSRNPFLTSYYNTLYYASDVTGMNVGSTSEAGYAAVITAEHDGTAYLAIAMGSSSDGDTIYALTSVRAMLDWAYGNFKYIRVISGTTVICDIPVKMSGGTDHVALMPEDNVDVFMEGDIDPEKDIKRTPTLLYDSLTAPVEIGQVVGFLTLSYEDEIVATVNLVVKSDIARSETLYLFSLFSEFFSSRLFRILVIAVILAALFYVLYIARKQYRQKEREKFRRSQLFSQAQKTSVHASLNGAAPIHRQATLPPAADRTESADFKR